eukprot:6206239-Pleurochrysis_carterae.AAC.2
MEGADSGKQGPSLDAGSRGFHQGPQRQPGTRRSCCSQSEGAAGRVSRTTLQFACSDSLRRLWAERQHSGGRGPHIWAAEPRAAVHDGSRMGAYEHRTPRTPARWQRGTQHRSAWTQIVSKASTGALETRRRRRSSSAGAGSRTSRQCTSARSLTRSCRHPPPSATQKGRTWRPCAPAGCSQHPSAEGGGAADARAQGGPKPCAGPRDMTSHARARRAFDAHGRTREACGVTWARAWRMREH